MRKKILFILNLILLFLILIVITSTHAGEMEKIERSFSIKEGGTLTLVSDIGAIEVQSIPGEKVKVEIRREFRGWDDNDIKDFLEDFQVDMEQVGTDVNVTVHLKRRWKDLWDHVKVRFYIEVPSKYSVDLQTAGGSISVEDLEGKVRAATSGGSLNFGSITGPVHGTTSGGSIGLEKCVGDVLVKTSGGSISIGNVIGNVDAHTSGGSISMEQVKGSMEAVTSGGSVNIDEVEGPVNASTSGGSMTAYITKQPESDCSMKTSGGSITVYLPSNISLDIDAKTSWGKVESDFDVLVSGSQNKNQLRGKIREGGPELYLRTSGGNIYILEK